MVDDLDRHGSWTYARRLIAEVLQGTSLCSLPMLQGFLCLMSNSYSMPILKRFNQSVTFFPISLGSRTVDLVLNYNTIISTHYAIFCPSSVVPQNRWSVIELRKSCPQSKSCQRKILLFRLQLLSNVETLGKPFRQTSRPQLSFS